MNFCCKKRWCYLTLFDTLIYLFIKFELIFQTSFTKNLKKRHLNNILYSFQLVFLFKTDNVCLLVITLELGNLIYLNPCFTYYSVHIFRYTAKWVHTLILPLQPICRQKRKINSKTFILGAKRFREYLRIFFVAFCLLVFSK